MQIEFEWNENTIEIKEKELNGVKNPYAKILKKQITIRLNAKTIDYFKKMAKEIGIPYQVLIDSYLTDCAANKRKLDIRWL